MKNLHDFFCGQFAWYNKWHQQKFYKSIHLSSVVVVSAVMAILLISGFVRLAQAQSSSKLTCENYLSAQFGQKLKKDFQKENLTISYLDGITKDITNLTSEYNKADAGKKLALTGKLQLFAKTRKQQLVDVMRQNPDAAIFSILSPAERSVLSAVTNNCVEAPIVLEGILEITHADFFQDKLSADQYLLVTNQGQRIILHPARGLKDDLESRTKVRISGFVIDNELIFDGLSTIAKPSIEKSGIDVLGQPGNPPVLGDQRIITVMANFNNTTQPSIPQSVVQDVVYSQTDNYYKENSYQKISMSGDVINWTTLGIPSTCDLTAIRNAVVVAVDPVVNFPSYSRILVVVPFMGNCGWAGISTIGKTTFSTADGNVTMSTSAVMATNVTAGIVGHELGHGYGNNHANFLNCGSYSIRSPISTYCSSLEYGDNYSVMGYASGKWHFSAPHKEYFGWLDTSNIQTVTTNGTYVIEPIETNTTGLKAIKIQRGPLDYLYVEYRQPIGSDVDINGVFPSRNDVYDGALVHIINGGMSYPNLIDTTPPADNFTTVIKPGSAFQDPDTGTQIQVVSKDLNSIVLNVTVGRTDFTGPSTTWVSPAAYSPVSGAVNLRADATDESGIQKIEFYKTTAINITPQLLGISTTAPYSYAWNTTNIPNGILFLKAIAYDTLGNVTSTPYTQVSIANSDSTFPTVSLVSPANGSTVPSPVTFRTTASDNVGIWKVWFVIDGNLHAIDYDAPYEYTANLALGNHTAYTRAYDFVGNYINSPVSSFMVAVADTTPPTVSITSPADNSIYTSEQAVNISASASDNVGVTKVEFYNNGFLYTTKTSAPYSVSWPLTYGNNGSYGWTAKAYDAQNNSTVSSIITVIVNIPDSVSPSVSITSPVSGTTYTSAQTVNIEAMASDNVGVDRVEFFRNGTLFSTDASIPYSTSWTFALADNGSYNWTAKAYDTIGNNATSSLISLEVNIPTPTSTPVPAAISLNPASLNFTRMSGTPALPPSMVTLSNVGGMNLNWSATTNQTWCHVSPGSSTVNTGSNTQVSVSVDIINTVGVYNCVVSFADSNASNSPQNVAVTYYVNADSVVPITSITSPLNNATVVKGKNLTISATASDNVGVTKVEFYIGTTLQCTDTSSPYTCVWKVPNSPNKTYKLQTKVYDIQGNIGNSSVITVISK